MENTAQVRLLRSISSSAHILIGVILMAVAPADDRFVGFPFIIWGLVQKIINLCALGAEYSESKAK